MITVVESIRECYYEGCKNTIEFVDSLTGEGFCKEHLPDSWIYGVELFYKENSKKRF
jgi:hypothetical protein